MMKFVAYVLLTLCFTYVNAQSDSSGQKKSIQIQRKYIASVSAKADLLGQKLDKKATKALAQLKKQEAKIQDRLSKLDSVAAFNLLSSSNEKYALLEQKLKIPQTGKEFVPFLDSVNTSLKFLKEAKGFISQTREVQEKLKESLSKIAALKNQLQKAEEIKKFLRERKQYLKEQLQKFGFAKELKKINKQVYYYSQTVKEIKNVLNDPKKIEKHALVILRKIPAFNEFMAKNSFMSSVFGTPSTSSISNIPLAGLQTRAAVQQNILNSFAFVNNSTPQQFVSQQLQSGTAQINELKKKIAFVDFNGNSEAAPDFKANEQKGKSFLKRLEIGTNVQFGKVNKFLPTTGEFALSMGYKLNNNGIIGIGSAYKLGLGSGPNNIQFTNQGLGLRSFLDWKIKGGFYLSGGYEKNYLPGLNNLNLSVKPEIWQESGLVGIVKKYSIKKDKQAYMQILFDFLSYKNIPRSQPFLLRTGWNF